jgi:signal transduction histidine kinase
MTKDQDKILTREQLVGELVRICQQMIDLEIPDTGHARDRELALLNRAGQEFATTSDMQHITERLLPMAAEIIGAEGASVWLWEDVSESWLVCRMAYHHRNPKPLPVDLRLSSDEGVAGWVAQTRESAIVLDAQNDPRFFPGIDEQTGFTTISLIAVPMWARDRVIGILEVVNKLGGDFDRDDCILAETLATSAAIAIDNVRLVDALRQRTLDLQAAHKQLDTLSHTLADDVRGSLALIVSFAQMLEMDYGTLPDEDLGRYIHMMAARGRKIVDVIDGLLETPAGPATEIEEQIEPLDMASIVAVALDRVSYRIERYQPEIILPDSWPAALGYGPWIEEVWTSYVGNAIKYGGRPPRVELGATVPSALPSGRETPSPVPPTGEEAPSSVSLPGGEASPSVPPSGGEVEGGMVRFWVRDNGPGLSPGEQVKLFAPSARRERTRDGQYGSELALVQRIVEKLGGKVGVESEKGQGSLFYFTLPSA